MDSLENKITSLDKKVANLDKNAVSLEIKITRLENKVISIESNVIKLEQASREHFSLLQKFKHNIGGLYEAILRREIVKKYGQKYADPFNIVNLYGAIRLALPNEQ